MRFGMLLPLLSLAAACEVFDPEVDVVHGDIAGSAIQPAVTLPAVVAAGQPFRVGIQTSGNSCYTFQRTEIRTDGLVVEIRPFDRVDTDDACDDFLRIIDHSVTLSFQQRGIATVHVIGRTNPDRAREVFTYAVRIE
jgi:hypothetical protein